MHPVLIMLSGMYSVVAGILWLRLHAFLALLLGAFLVAFLTPAQTVERHALKSGATAAAARAAANAPPGQRVVEGFGRTAGQLGVMIGMASIIGSALLHTGAAERIVRSLLAVTGQARASLSFLASGFLLGIPIFFDTVFYLLVPLAKAMRLRTGRDYLLYMLAIVAGGTMTHSLVPPTPVATVRRQRAGRHRRRDESSSGSPSTSRRPWATRGRTLRTGAGRRRCGPPRKRPPSSKRLLPGTRASCPRCRWRSRRS